MNNCAISYCTKFDAGYTTVTLDGVEYEIHLCVWHRDILLSDGPEKFFKNKKIVLDEKRGYIIMFSTDKVRVNGYAKRSMHKMPSSKA